MGNSAAEKEAPVPIADCPGWSGGRWWGGGGGGRGWEGAATDADGGCLRRRRRRAPRRARACARVRPRPPPATSRCGTLQSVVGGTVARGGGGGMGSARGRAWVEVPGGERSVAGGWRWVEGGGWRAGGGDCGQRETPLRGAPARSRTAAWRTLPPTAADARVAPSWALPWCTDPAVAIGAGARSRWWGAPPLVASRRFVSCVRCHRRCPPARPSRDRPASRRVAALPPLVWTPHPDCRRGASVPPLPPRVRVGTATAGGCFGPLGGCRTCPPRPRSVRRGSED